MSMVKDYITGEKIQKSSGYAIIDKLNSNGDIKYLYSMFRIFCYIGKYGGNNYYFSNKKVAIDLGFEEHQVHNIFLKKGESRNKRYIRKFIKFDFHPMFKKTSSMSVKEKIKYGIISPTYLLTDGLRYTYGIEIETSEGLVTPKTLEGINVKAVYDGSVYTDDGEKAFGGEYVTGVLRGDTGMLQLKKLLRVLSTRTKVNSTCSVHVHVGGINFTKENVVFLWKVAHVLEKELYSIMPRSRANRDHCRPMSDASISVKPKKGETYEEMIDKTFTKIFKKVSLGREKSKVLNKKFNHPAGHSCGYNTSTPRYWWVNFVPAMFNLKGMSNYTIEYRMMGATLDFEKVKNWILICMAMVYMAENEKRYIMSNANFTIKDILQIAFPKKWEYLNEYIENRKKFFHGDNPSLAELSEHKASKQSKTPPTFKTLIWE